jgi:hypothetical protein
MENKRNKLIIFVKYFILLLVGSLIGLSIGMKLGVSSVHFGKDLAAVARYSEYAGIKYKYAKYPEAKMALLNFINLLDNYKSSTDPMISQSVLTTDKILTYCRLARLSRKNGDDTEAKQFMALAVEECKRTSWKNCSDEKVENILTAVEKNDSLPDKPNDNK